MKLTTKLLKEMIQQEMTEMQYGGDDFEMQPMKYVVVGPNGEEKEVSEHSFQMYVDQGYPQEPPQGGTRRVSLGDEQGRRDFKDFVTDMDADIAEMTPEERKYAGL